MDADGPIPDLLGDDPLGAFDAMSAAFVDAVNSPGAMERDAVLPFATLPAPVALSYREVRPLGALLGHGAGNGTDASTRRKTVVLEGQQIAEMIIARPMRDGDTFCDVVVVPDDASALDRLVAFSGRSV